MGTVNCNFGIAAAILQDCAARPTAGAEGVAYAINRKDIATITKDPTNLQKVTAFTLALTKKAYKIGGFKKEIEAGFDVVVSDTNPDKYTQYFKFESWQIGAEATKNLDNLADLVIIVERKNKGVNGDGAFIMLGLETGLYKSADSARLNENSGKRTIELTNQGEEESTVSYHIIDAGGVAATKALLEALV